MTDDSQKQDSPQKPPAPPGKSIREQLDSDSVIERSISRKPVHRQVPRTEANLDPPPPPPPPPSEDSSGDDANN